MNTLFGMPILGLFTAIAQVESDRGKTSDNVYQIDSHGGHAYVDDVNAIMRLNARYETRKPIPFSYDDVYDVGKSEKMMLIYWRHYGAIYTRDTGKEPTYEVLARIHNGGPNGWKKPATWRYWQKVLKEMNGGAK